MGAPAALAQAPTPTAAPAPPPAPAPAAGKLSLEFERVVRKGRRGNVALAGTKFAVRGTLEPFRPGQRARVRVFRGSKQVARRSVRIRPGRGSRRGTFALTFRTGGRGRLTVRAAHARTPELVALRSRAARLRVIGSRGRTATRLLQAGLDRLGYAVSRSGSFDAATGRAVMAYRKVNGLPRTSSPSRAILRSVLRRRGAFKPKYPKAGRHLEADLSRQVLALVEGSRVVRTYVTSSGAASTPTILGSFQVYRRDLGTNALGMVDAAYFRGGYAVHGYESVPPFGASHGCLRVPIPNARAIHDWLTMGTRVIVYR